jgi:hypothetical protein
LNGKITANVRSLDFLNQACNCNPKQGPCDYGGKFRRSIVVYQANCVVTGMKYIGNTQQLVKSRMQQHKQDTKWLFFEGRKSDSFASHFAKRIPEGTTAKDVNLIKYKVDILWQGTPLACVKTFGTSACKLCAKERLAILKLTQKMPHFAINSAWRFMELVPTNWHSTDLITMKTTNTKSVLIRLEMPKEPPSA